MKRFSGLLTLVVGIAASALAFWWLRQDPPPPAPPQGRPAIPHPVTLATVESRDLRPTVRLTGTVLAPDRAELAFDLDGFVDAVHVRDAQPVTRGELLAELDARDAELAVAEAQAELSLQQRRLEKLEAGERVEVVAQLAADVTTAEADLRLAELDVARGVTLVEKSVISQAEQDRRVAVRDASEGRLTAARERLAEGRAGTREEDVAIGRAEVARAQAQLELAQLMLAKTKLTAPFDGVVVRRLLVAGDYAQRGASVIDLVDASALEIELEVPSRYVGRLDEGATVRVTLDDRPDWALATEVDAASPLAEDASRNFRALARLEGEELADRALRPGMFVRGELELDLLPGALVVPADAIRLVDAGQVLVVAAPIPGASPPSGPPTGPPQPWLQAAWVPVRLLGRSGDDVAVAAVEGELRPGDQVVVVGVDRAEPGNALMPAMGSGPPPPASPPAGAADAGGEESGG